MPDNTNKAAVLIEIGTDLIVQELKRRAVAQGKTTLELLVEAEQEWKQAETSADELAQEGHGE